ncbi:MAG TPA: SpoIIE family protein phosphatase [Pyrinomonadaceae bacterium]|nr:SpoIIE family protein phosphatase [Pyrinomonadaceae bacterium]
MVAVIEPVLREQLIERRNKLEAAVNAFQEASELLRLLHEVDAALIRMEAGSYGLCEVCHDPVEADRLIADPLTRFCLDHLTPNEQRALEEDLQLASRIQQGLLPDATRTIDGWEVSFHYSPAGLVSGDYCDLIPGDDGSLHFVLGDVSGKGVAASMLMAHLHAMFRTLISINLPLEHLLERASRVFCESTLPTHYATLACGKASANGQVEICNAGHLPPLLINKDGARKIDATSLPLGIFCTEHFSVSQVQMEKGDTLFLYTDGLSETVDGAGSEYGVDRLSNLLLENRQMRPASLIDTCVKELNSFCDGRILNDDLTLMAIRRAR